MSDPWQRFALWFLCRFRAFRELERRLELLSEPRQRERELLPNGSMARLEVEVLFAALLHAPCFIHVALRPSRRSDDVSMGELQVQLIEGSGP